VAPTRHVVVTPAKAGVQAVNDQKPPLAALVFKSYLWVADPRQVTFSCAHKRKSPKRMRPGRFAAQTTSGPLRASRRPGARLTRRAQKRSPARCARSSCRMFLRLRLDQKSRDGSRPGSVLGSLRRGLEKTNVLLSRTGHNTSGNKPAGHGVGSNSLFGVVRVPRHEMAGNSSSTLPFSRIWSHAPWF